MTMQFAPSYVRAIAPYVADNRFRKAPASTDLKKGAS